MVRRILLQERESTSLPALRRWVRCARRAPLLVGMVCIVLVGCQADPPPATAPVAAKSGVRTEREVGPIQVTVEVVPAPARLSDEPKLTVSVRAKAGVDVELPPFGEAVGDFLVLDFQEPLVEVQGDHEITRQIYTLEPPRTGRLEIDPITVTYTDRSAAAAAPQQLETEALVVEVVSLIDAEAPSLDALQGFAPPVELPQRTLWWPWIVAALLLAGLLAIAAAWLRRRKVAESQVPQLSPRDVAARELKRIWQEELHLHDIKQFYTELTGIVRKYIEGTAGVHAPEQTTEEFLREISNGQIFTEAERHRLAAFLESSDLVKFAAHTPDREDIDDAYQRARLFVGVDRDGPKDAEASTSPQVARHE